MNEEGPSSKKPTRKQYVTESFVDEDGYLGLFFCCKFHSVLFSFNGCSVLFSLTYAISDTEVFVR